MREIEFQPATPTHQFDFNVLVAGVLIGTFFWVSNARGEKERAIARDLTGRVAIVPNEKEAVLWLAKCIKESNPCTTSSVSPASSEPSSASPFSSSNEATESPSDGDLEGAPLVSFGCGDFRQEIW